VVQGVEIEVENNTEVNSEKWPLSSAFGTNKIDKTRFWPCLEPFFRQKSFNPS